jgi:aspartate dehydrogenase
MARAVCWGEVPGAALLALFDRDLQRAAALARELSVANTDSFDRFLATAGLGLVVECASADAVRAYAELVLEHEKELLLMSSGALLDPGLFQRLASIAQCKGKRLQVPSGALGGMDALRSVRGHLQEVSLTTTKPPVALRGAPGFKDWEAREITEARVIFEGPALEAVRLFPANVNVAATVSLAGLGPERTRVRVVADPRAPGNVHEVTAKGDFGVLRFTMENRPHPQNPRTSYLAVLSALETLRAACAFAPRVGT